MVEYTEIAFFVKLPKRMYYNFRQINLCLFLTMAYVFLTDDAFPLGKHCLKPYSQSGLTPIKCIFNYCLSRLRRVTENAFGILTNRFRGFTTRMCLDPNKATIITLATLVLHNMLRRISYKSYTPEGFIDMETESGDIIEENVGASVLQSLPKSNTRKAKHPNISEIHLLIIFGDLARLPCNGK